jgi:hypothetical protein
MPNTLSQTKAIYARAARSAVLRRARLLRDKALRKQQRLQLQARLVAEQEARTRDRTIFNEHFNQQQPNTVLSLATSFCRACCGFFILYLGIVLLYHYGVHLLRCYQ